MIKGRSILTLEEQAFIKANYLTLNIAEMSREIGRSRAAIRDVMKNHSLILPAEIVAERKLKILFQKGREAHNKGKPNIPHTPEALARMQATMFKKGSKPRSTTELTDKAVAAYLSVTDGRKTSKKVQQEILKHPELIEAKRNHLLINRKIKAIKDGRNKK